MAKPAIVSDPRPDLAYDSREWTALLTLVTAWDKHVGGVLHGFRCGGLRLHRGGTGYVLRPDYDPGSSKWPNEGEYNADRDKWLNRHRTMIVEALKVLNEGAKGGELIAAS